MVTGATLPEIFEQVFLRFSELQQAKPIRKLPMISLWFGLMESEDLRTTFTKTSCEAVPV